MVSACITRVCAPQQVNFYYGAPTPYAESIAPSHHSNYAHYYDEEDEAWEMPNFYNEAFVRGKWQPRSGNAGSSDDERGRRAWMVIRIPECVI